MIESLTTSRTTTRDLSWPDAHCAQCDVLWDAGALGEGCWVCGAPWAKYEPIRTDYERLAGDIERFLWAGPEITTLRPANAVPLDGGASR